MTDEEFHAAATVLVFLLKQAASHERYSRDGEQPRVAIEAIGRLICEARGDGGMDAMLQLLEERMPEHEDGWLDILDKRWDGIGGWIA